MPRIAYANVFVTDLDRACAFYQTAFGFTLESKDADHGYASFDAGAIRLGVAQVAGDQAELAGRHTGLGIDVEDLEAEHARLVAAGVEFPMAPERQPWGGFMALVADPDGNVFYLDQISAAHG